MTPGFLAQAVGRMDPPSAVMGKTVRGAEF